MVQIDSSLPEWLQKWLKLPFYDDAEKCSTHYKQYNTNYCAACMKGPVCNCCSQEFSKQHKDHPQQILQVMSASRRAGIQVKDIEKLLDVSKIQRYSINNGTIVYLNSKKEASDAVLNRANSCRTCRRSKLLQPAAYEFCSIACKAEMRGRDMVIEKKFERKSGSQSPSSGVDFVAADEMIGERLPSPPPPPPISTKIKNMEENISKLDVDIHSHQCTPLSFRKRARKGIPHRAPLK